MISHNTSRWSALGKPVPLDVKQSDLHPDTTTAPNECVLFQNLTNLDRSRLRRDRYSPVKKNAERFARIDLDFQTLKKNALSIVR